MRLIDFVYTLFLLVVTFDPTGYYTSSLKIILFIILVIYGMFKFNNRKISVANIVIMLSMALLPILSIVYAYIIGTLRDTDYALSHITSMLFVFLFIYLITMNVNTLLRIVWFNGLVLSIVTLILLTFSIFIDFSTIYSLVTINPNIMMAVDREFLGIPITGLYFRTGPFIMFSFVYHLYKYHGPFKLIISIIMYLALAFSGSRTPMIMQTLILLIYFYDSKIFGRRILRIVSFLAIIGVFYLTYKLATEEGQDSNDLKFDNISSYKREILKTNTFIFGDGVGSVFYAKGNSERLAFTELSYFDLLRMYGVPLGIYFSVLFYIPPFGCKCFFEKNLFLNRFMLTYIMFLILAGTNPILLGSIGLTALTLAMVIQQKTMSINRI